MFHNFMDFIACTDVCTDVYTDVCTNVCTDVCTDVCTVGHRFEVRLQYFKVIEFLNGSGADIRFQPEGAIFY